MDKTIKPHLIGAHITAEMRKEIDRLCVETGMTVSEIVRAAVADFIKQRPAKEEKT